MQVTAQHTHDSLVDLRGGRDRHGYEHKSSNQPPDRPMPTPSAVNGQGMGTIAAMQPQYRVTLRVVFVQEAAFFTKNAFSVASAFNPQRIFTAVQSAMYWH